MLTRGEQLAHDRANFALRTKKKAVPNKTRLTFKYEHEEVLRLLGEAKAAALDRLNNSESIVERDAILLGLVWDAEGYVNLDTGRRVKIILREEPNAKTNDSDEGTSDRGTEEVASGE